MTASQPPLWEYPRHTAKPIQAQTEARQFDNSGSYVLPTDRREIKRYDFQHWALYMLFRGRLHFAPISPASHPLAKILDVGTGSGRWAIAMATHFPEGAVWGVDAHLPPPDITGPLPRNCFLHHGDVLEGLRFQTLPSGLFDLVHQRMIQFGIPRVRWFSVIQELLRVCKVGGWLNLMEILGIVTDADYVPSMARVCAIAAEVAWRGKHVDITAGAHLADLLWAAGCADVRSTVFNVPLGPWGGHAGELMRDDALALAESLGEHVAAMHIMTADEYAHLLANARWELDQAGHMCCLPFGVAIGRRAA
jgi:SAM-dependent methyltransferase